ncbi:MAG: glycine--tRNA ligase subunit beta [Pseudolysinimonas sp.]
MTDFLLELRSEEIPARMQDKAREDLARLFAAELSQAGLRVGAIETYATPRRLALIARDVPEATEATSEEIKGPRAGAPPQALEGFLRKTGLTAEQLVERDGVLFAVIDKPGLSARHVLHNAIEVIVHKFPWPKSMRWGDASASTASLRWVRPLQGIVALLDDSVVKGTVAGIEVGRATAGHRFMAPGAIEIGNVATYADQLRAAHVIVDQDERRTLIRDRATALAAEAGLVLVEDEGLVAENAGLTEWPVPLLGRFDADFLAVPPEVIQLTARVNQKYFVCRDAAGKLANAFICTANIDARDGGTKIVEGNRKVLAARLADARFFYETDLKVPLEEQARKLEKIVFHEKLGTVADKVERVAKLARWLVEEGIVGHRSPAKAGVQGDGAQHDPGLLPSQEHLADMAERAARLAKADLVTGMVGEFPELQGLMGGYCAAAQGEDPAVAAAIRDHYKPVGQGDEVPTDPVTVAVSLADKLDTLAQFFIIDERPTGSKDPFALRRAVLGILSLIFMNRIRLNLWPFVAGQVVMGAKPNDDLVETAKRQFWGKSQQEIWAQYNWLDGSREPYPERLEKLPSTVNNVLDFFADRLKVQQREAGVRHDLIDAVFALGGEDDLVRLLARVHALQSFITTEDGANLLAGYKRAANILKKEGWGGSDTKPLSYTPEKAEAALADALDVAEPSAADAVRAEDFEAAMAALATLRAPIDAFFDSVTVNDPDPAKRSARLALLARVRDAVHNVADFSKIEG